MKVADRNDGETGQSSIAGLRVADVMHHGVLTCPRDTVLTDVARLMADERVHCVVVRDDEDGRGARSLWGVVSDLDLVAAATVRPLDEQTAGGSSASPVVIVSPEETLEQAARLMTEQASAHLIVVDSVTDRPVGVLSTLDVAGAIASQAPERRSA